MKKKKGSIGTRILLLLVFLVGFGLIMYPTASDWWNSFHQSRSIAQYDQKIQEMDKSEIEKAWKEAQEYNENLKKRGQQWSAIDPSSQDYQQALNITGDGIMGHVEIPSLGISLPISHGTDESVLQEGIGHLAGSSLPTGGEGNHCAISGHRGLPSAKLFTDIDKLEAKDIFILYILDQTLTYEVDEINTVLPEETEKLGRVEGMDLCTLITCTPYGVNSHRLLVRGHRIPNLTEEETQAIEQKVFHFEYLIIPVAACIVVLVIIYKRRTRRRGKKNNQES